MTGNIIDYRLDRFGNVFGKCFCGTEQKLTKEEIRILMQTRPEIFLRDGAF